MELLDEERDEAAGEGGEEDDENAGNAQRERVLGCSSSLRIVRICGHHKRMISMAWCVESVYLCREEECAPLVCCRHSPYSTTKKCPPPTNLHPRPWRHC